MNLKLNLNIRWILLLYIPILSTDAVMLICQEEINIPALIGINIFYGIPIIIHLLFGRVVVYDRQIKIYYFGIFAFSIEYEDIKEYYFTGMGFNIVALADRHLVLVMKSGKKTMFSVKEEQIINYSKY